MTMRDQQASLTVPGCFSGPPGSGNGGYVAGSLAAEVPGRKPSLAVEVTLRQPPPLDVAMQVRHVPTEDPTNVADQPVSVLLFGGAKIAEARSVDLDLEPVEAVSSGEATEAMTRYVGLTSHPFPTCFVCGTERAEGDGLRIFPGPVAADRVASTWVPHENLATYSDLLDGGLQRVDPRIAWAALDCVGGWAGGLGERRMVLGRMTAHVDALPVVGEPHVVVGGLLGVEGRKTLTTSTLFDSDARIVGRALHTWVAIDASAFTSASA